MAFPAEFHAQTAAEAAIILHTQVADRLDKIDRIRIDTQESAVRIISKSGPLMNPADRDHCLQYIVAVALIHGRLDADHYEDAAAADQRIDRLRQLMEVAEQPGYSRDYLDPEKRSITNAVQVFFTDGTATDRIEIEYPLGHRRRRSEALPLLREKFRTNVATRFAAERVDSMLERLFDSQDIDNLSLDAFMDEFVPLLGNREGEAPAEPPQPSIFAARREPRPPETKCSTDLSVHNSVILELSRNQRRTASNDITQERFRVITA